MLPAVKAIGLYRYLPVDDPEALLDLEVEDPRASGRDLLVEVKAVAVNPVDYKSRAPRAQVETAPKILGWDVAGMVKAVGPEVTLFKAGDAVYYAGSRTRPGGNSELHLVDERIVGRKPRNLRFAEAAALPLTTLTAWEALFDRLGISKTGAHGGRSVLIIGGAGGVGSIAIQLAKRLARLRVIATASRPESSTWARELGADEVIDHTKDLAGQLAALGGAEVDYILCCNSTDHHFPGFARMVIAQVVKLPDVVLALAGDRRRGDGQQLVGGLDHGRDHHDGLLPNSRFDNRGDPSDGGGGFDRGPAEFHDDHQSSSPSEYISSALSTAAPAAPRTVLCPNATNL